MPNQFLRTLILCFCFFQFAQTTFANDDYYNRLYYLGKFWGYVKYFHSEVSDGDCLIDWDNELIARIPEVKAANTDAEFNQILLSMLDVAGPMEIVTSNPPNVPNDLKINLDLDWLDDAFFSDEVISKLLEIEENFRKHPICNITTYPAGNANFEADDAYYTSQGNYPGEAYRILAIFRYWNVIKYWFPYHHLMDQHWDETLKQFIPPIVESANATAYHLAFKEFTTYINDSHSFYNSNYYYTQIRGSAHLPFQTQFVENEMVITKVLPAWNDEFAIGDIVKELDGYDIYELRDSIRKFTEGSNDITVNRNINYFLEWGPNGWTTAKIENANGTFTHNVSRTFTNYNALNPTSTDPVWYDSLSITGCYYGYVDMGRLEQNQVATMFNDLWNTDAIIIDIRNYPNGTLWYMVDYLYLGPVPVASFTVPDVQYPGTVTWADVWLGQGSGPTYQGQLLILQNEYTQSQAEYTIMGLESHPGSVKIGSQTSAADGNVSWVYVPGNIQIYFTNLGTYYPDKTETQRIGIVPDLEVHPSIDGLRAGVDEVLKAAYDVNLGCNMVNTNNADRAVFLVNVSPNPFDAYLNVRILRCEEVSELTLYDMAGKLIKREMRGTNSQLDLGDMESGIYFLKVSNSLGSVIQKVVKGGK